MEIVEDRRRPSRFGVTPPDLRNFLSLQHHRWLKTDRIKVEKSNVGKISFKKSVQHLFLSKNPSKLTWLKVIGGTVSDIAKFE